MIEHGVILIVSFSAGVVTGRLVRAPIGRWAMLVIVVAAVIGAAYLYGMAGGLQTAVRAAPWLKWLPGVR